MIPKKEWARDTLRMPSIGGSGGRMQRAFPRAR